MLELKHLVRARAVSAGLAVLLAAAVCGTLQGQIVIERQRHALAASPSLQREQHAAVLNLQPPDANAGDQLYYLFFHTAHEPSPWASVALGQRDIQSYNVKIRLLALHGQLYDADLANPLLAAFGSFDLSFVIGVLAPLLVIAVGYNVWSAEQELGTWDLIRSQPTSALRVLAVKVALRMALVIAVATAAILAAVVVLQLPLDARLGAALVLTVLYVAAWTGVTLIVVGLGRSSEFNLAMLLGTWVLWAVLGPALANTAIAARYPLPQALELTVRQRQGYHASWDRPVAETMARFYERYPEWAHVPVPEDTYSNAWYYAMQHRGDTEAAPAAAAYFAALDQRIRVTSRALALFPPAGLQLAFNALARTDLESHVGYLRSVVSFHGELKRFFFPVIFENRTIAAVGWPAAPTHRYADHRPSSSLRVQMVALVAHAAMWLTAGAWMLRRRVDGPRARRQLAPFLTTSSPPATID